MNRAICLQLLYKIKRRMLIITQSHLVAKIWYGEPCFLLSVGEWAESLQDVVLDL